MTLACVPLTRSSGHVQHCVMPNWQALLLVVVGVVIYVIPWFIALWRHVYRAWVVLLVTIVLGWTVFGWVACLIWSCYAHTVLDHIYRHDSGWELPPHQPLFRPDPNQPAKAQE